MSKFASENSTKRIEFDDDEWVDIRDSISWKELQDIRERQEKLDRKERSLDLFVFFILDWNFKDEGKSVEVNVENLSRLDMRVFAKLDREMAVVMKIEEEKEKKKDDPNSSKQ